MDVNFWGAARFHSNINIPSAHPAPVGNEGMMEDEVRTWFPCPFCYVEIEVPLLCVHLQQDHCFDFRNAVCPLCAESLGRDALGHFTLQHSHSVKRRRCQKAGWNNAPMNVTTRDLRETIPFLGGGNEPPAPDPVLTTFICTAPVDVQRDGLQEKGVAETRNAECLKLSSSGEKETQCKKEGNEHAVFLQELLMSTIFHEN